VTVERRQIGPQPAQIENGIDPAQQMIMWNAFLEIELVEQSILSTNRRPHHYHFPTLMSSGQRITPPRSFQPSSSTASAKSGCEQSQQNDPYSITSSASNCCALGT
jgi:hypothetical protein